MAIWKAITSDQYWNSVSSYQQTLVGDKDSYFIAWILILFIWMNVYKFGVLLLAQIQMMYVKNLWCLKSHIGVLK